MRLRFHSWRNSSETNDPHDHRTWFISIPLYGIFIEKRYKEVPGNIDVYSCRDDFNKERLNIKPVYKAGLELIETIYRLPFIPYFCPKDAIHTFKPLNKGFAASLVLFGPQTRLCSKGLYRENYSAKCPTLKRLI